MCEVWLVGVGRNLNRAIRTCSAFGVHDVRLLDCPGAVIAGQLYGDARHVVVTTSDRPFPRDGTLVLETWGDTDIEDAPWPLVERIVLGGETQGVPRQLPTAWSARIAQPSTPVLTVEAALAIALFVRHCALRRGGDA